MRRAQLFNVFVMKIIINITIMIMNIIFNHLHDHHEYCFKPSLVVINIMNYWQEIKMDDEIKCAPWNTSRAYVQVLTENNISFIMEIH